MFTAALAFLKGKLFSQAGSFLLPIVGLLAVFLIWNSDLIMSKFGFETTTNLKAEVTRLQGEVTRLEETNKKQLEEINKIKTSAGVTISVVEGVAEDKATTKNTVSDIIDARRKKADKLLADAKLCACDTVVDNKPQTSNLLLVNKPVEKQTTVQVNTPKVEKPKTQTVPPEVVNQLSADNIQALNEAYDAFFPETGK